MTVTFTSVKKSDDAGNWLVAITDTNQEVMVSGAAVAKIQTGPLPLSLEGETFTNSKGNLAYRLPQERKSGSGRPGFQRDPMQDLVGIAHSQALEWFARSVSSDVPTLGMREVWGNLRPHIKQMATEIAQDRLAILAELKSASPQTAAASPRAERNGNGGTEPVVGASPAASASGSPDLVESFIAAGKQAGHPKGALQLKARRMFPEDAQATNLNLPPEKLGEIAEAMGWEFGVRA